MATPPFDKTQLPSKTKLRSQGVWTLLALVLLAAVAAGCYNNNTGDANVGDAIKFKLPAFPESGGNAVQVFTEMHYQPSFRSQQGPRLLPPPDSVPITGKELRYASLDEYKALQLLDATVRSYDPAATQRLYMINCAVCHGPGLKGDGPIVAFMQRGPFPADLTSEATRASTDGELFGFISGGGRQGLAARLRGRQSASPMPEFRRLLTEEERWALVKFLRSPIGP